MNFNKCMFKFVSFIFFLLILNNFMLIVIYFMIMNNKMAYQNITIM